MHVKRRLHTLCSSTFGLLLVWGGLLGAAGVALGQGSYEILHAFAQRAWPHAGVIRDSAGTLYGTTHGGGAFGWGMVYKLEASGEFTSLHSFNYNDLSDGGGSYAGVIRDSAGTLYGTTPLGGAGCCGAVYKLEASGEFTLLHSFNYSDGRSPSAGVIQDSAGTLYGTTNAGGVFDDGTVYKLEASGVLTVLHSFNTFDRSDGGYPFTGVIRDSTGTLYGTTLYGGAFGAGTVYQVDANGKFTILHSFTGSDGANPFGAMARS